MAGGSTLTQQLVQLVAPQPRTFAGKAVEALLALRLERAVGKATILEQYVNRAPFGHGAVGVEAAARLYIPVLVRQVLDHGMTADRTVLYTSVGLMAGAWSNPDVVARFDDVRATRAASEADCAAL